MNKGETINMCNNPSLMNYKLVLRNETAISDTVFIISIFILCLRQFSQLSFTVKQEMYRILDPLLFAQQQFFDFRTVSLFKSDQPQ